MPRLWRDEGLDMVVSALGSGRMRDWMVVSALGSGGMRDWTML